MSSWGQTPARGTSEQLAQGQGIAGSNSQNRTFQGVWETGPQVQEELVSGPGAPDFTTRRGIFRGHLTQPPPPLEQMSI